MRPIFCLCVLVPLLEGWWEGNLSGSNFLLFGAFVLTLAFANFRFVCYLLILLPFIGSWLQGLHGFVWLSLWAAGLGIMCLIQIETRQPRTPQYEIVTRMFLLVYIPSLFYWWAIAEDVVGFWDWTWLWFVFVVGVYGVSYMLWLIVLKMLGKSLLNEDGSHKFWDQPWTPSFINPGMYASPVVSGASSAPMPRPTPSAPIPTPSVPSVPGIPVAPRRN